MGLLQPHSVVFKGLKASYLRFGSSVSLPILPFSPHPLSDLPHVVTLYFQFGRWHKFRWYKTDKTETGIALICLRVSQLLHLMQEIGSGYACPRCPCLMLDFNESLNPKTERGSFCFLNSGGQSSCK